MSPTYKVRAFQVQEISQVPISLIWKGIAQDFYNENAENQYTRIMFPKGNQLPSMRALAFDTSSTFTAEFQYVDFGEVQEPSNISTYTNKLGRKVKLQSILTPSEFDHAEKRDALFAMKLTLSLEKLTNEKLLHIHVNPNTPLRLIDK